MKEKILSPKYYILLVTKDVNLFHLMLTLPLSDWWFLDFWLMLQSRIFISFYTIHFFHKKKIFFFGMFIFQWINYSNVFICFWLSKGPSVKYVSNCGGDGGMGYLKCVQLRTGEGVSNLICTHTLSNVMFLTYFFSFFMFFYIKLFQRTKVSQNAFNFNQK